SRALGDRGGSPQSPPGVSARVLLEDRQRAAARPRRSRSHQLRTRVVQVNGGSEVYLGSCLCESIRYEIDSDLQAIVNCHCKYCSRAHGAPFTTLLFAPFSSLRILTGAERIARYPVERLGADRC